jgi:hypothetical protein
VFQPVVVVWQNHIGPRNRLSHRGGHPGVAGESSAQIVGDQMGKGVVDVNPEVFVAG